MRRVCRWLALSLVVGCGGAGGRSDAGAAGQDGASAAGGGDGGCTPILDETFATCFKGVVTTTTNCGSTVVLQCPNGCKKGQGLGAGDESYCNEGPDAGDAGGQGGSSGAGGQAGVDGG